MTSNGLRADIQALRGLAVLTVLIYHAELGWLVNGYLGVDVFFVISGYVITRLLRQQAQQGHLSLRDFYRKRAWRLLPAAYVVYVAAALAAIPFLAQEETDEFFFQVLGGLLFAGNMVLAGQIDYFAGEAALKPLLHIWSLGIEEQFYFLWPLVFCLRPVKWFPVAVAGAALSLALYIGFYDSRPTESFFYLPSRAWQLLAGAALALAAGGALQQRVQTLPAGLRNTMVLAAITVLLVLMAVPLPAAQAPWLAVLVTGLTAGVLALGSTIFDGRLAAPLVSAGNISYSLYLVHWPLFAYARNIYLEGRPIWLSLALVAASLLLAVLLHRFIETRFRRSQLSGRRTFLIFAITGLGILLLASAGLWQRDSGRFTEIRRFNYGLDASCASKARFKPKPACVREGRTRILIWGDSNAMHLVPGFLADPSLGVIQATKTVCTPLSFAAPLIAGNDKYGLAWSRKCLSFNRSVMRYIAQADIDTVVLSSPFELLLDEDNQLLTSDGKRLPVHRDQAVAYMQQTLADIRALGKRAVIVSPPPKSSYNIGMCLEKKLRGQLILGAAQACQIKLTDPANEHVPVFLAALAAREPVVMLHDYLCRHGECRTYEAGRFIYRDSGHLTYEGVAYIFQRYGIAAEALRRAR